MTSIIKFNKHNLLPSFFDSWERFPGTNLLEDVPGNLGVNLPAVNIKENDQEFILLVAAPGLKKEDFQISVNEQNVLSIRAQQQNTQEHKDEHYHRKEYSYSSFERNFVIPDKIAIDKIQAKYENNGILAVHLPKLHVNPDQGLKQISIG